MHLLVQRGLSGHRNMVRLDAGLNLPVVGLGASARFYYPEVGRMVGTGMILPEHGGVANAIGAVAGRVTMRETGQVTSAGEGVYRVHGPGAPEDFASEAAALAALEARLRGDAVRRAKSAGAGDISTSTSRDVKTAETEGRRVFVEAVVTVEATGRPRVAPEDGVQDASRAEV